MVLSELDVEPTDRVLEVGYGPGPDIKVATDAAREHVRSLVAFYVRALGDYYAYAASDIFARGEWARYLLAQNGVQLDNEFKDWTVTFPALSNSNVLDFYLAH